MRYFDDDAEYAQEQQECGSSEKPNNLLSEKQEQPEADLKIEIGHWMDSLDDKYCLLVEQYSRQDIKETARYFYGLGLNARKEE